MKNVQEALVDLKQQLFTRTPEDIDDMMLRANFEDVLMEQVLPVLSQSDVDAMQEFDTRDQLEWYMMSHVSNYVDILKQSVQVFLDEYDADTDNE